MGRRAERRGCAGSAASPRQGAHPRASPDSLLGLLRSVAPGTPENPKHRRVAVGGCAGCAAGARGCARRGWSEKVAPGKPPRQCPGHPGATVRGPGFQRLRRLPKSCRRARERAQRGGQRGSGSRRLPEGPRRYMPSWPLGQSGEHRARFREARPLRPPDVRFHGSPRPGATRAPRPVPPRPARPLPPASPGQRHEQRPRIAVSPRAISPARGSGLHPEPDGGRATGRRTPGVG